MSCLLNLWMRPCPSFYSITKLATPLLICKNDCCSDLAPDLPLKLRRLLLGLAFSTYGGEEATGTLPLWLLFDTDLLLILSRECIFSSSYKLSRCLIKFYRSPFFCISIWLICWSISKIIWHDLWRFYSFLFYSSFSALIAINLSCWLRYWLGILQSGSSII